MQDAVLEVRNLGISLPYDSGSIVSLSSKLLLHGVPKVAGDRLCYALYFNKAVFESLKIPLPGMATCVAPIARSGRLPTDNQDGAGDPLARGNTAGRRGKPFSGTDDSGTDEDGSGGGGREVEGEGNTMHEDGSCRTGDDSDNGLSGGTCDADGSSSGEGEGDLGGEEQVVSDVDMVGGQSAA